MEKQAIMERMIAKHVFFLFLGTSEVFYIKGSHEWKEVKSKGLLLTENPEKGKKKKKAKIVKLQYGLTMSSEVT